MKRKVLVATVVVAIVGLAVLLGKGMESTEYSLKEFY